MAAASADAAGADAEDASLRAIRALGEMARDSSAGSLLGLKIELRAAADALIARETAERTTVHCACQVRFHATARRRS